MISFVVAASRNNVIGRNGVLPWSLPDDLKFFREVTNGHAMIMGRKTFDSIGRVLPNRMSIVVTRQTGYAPEGAVVVSSVDEALAKAKEALAGVATDEVFVIGGGEIFRQALFLADRIYLTRIDADVEGDAFFPELDSKEWREVSRREGKLDSKNTLPHAFLVLERARNIMGT